MVYLAIALLCANLSTDSNNVQNEDTFVYERGMGSRRSTIRTSTLPIGGPARQFNFLDQEQGTGGDRGNVRPKRPTNPIHAGAFIVDQEQGTGGDRGNVRPKRPTNPVHAGAFIVDQEQGTGGDRGNVRPKRPTNPVHAGAFIVDQEQGTGGDRGNVRPPVKPKPNNPLA